MRMAVAKTIDEQVTELQAAKHAAVATEDFETAGSLKRQIDALTSDGAANARSTEDFQRNSSQASQLAAAATNTFSEARALMENLTISAEQERAQPGLGQYQSGQCPEPHVVQSAGVFGTTDIFPPSSLDASTDRTTGQRDAAKAKAAGNVLYKKRKFVEAIAKYSDAIRLDPACATYYFNRCVCYASLLPKADWEASRKDAEKCVALDVAYIKAWARLSRARIQLFDIEGSKVAVEKGLALEPTNEALLQLREEIDDLTTPLLSASAT